MTREVIFVGDELALLNALDRAGCVLTDERHFYCDMENDKLPFNSRLPVRIKGECVAADNGWSLWFRVVPAPRTAVIGAVFILLFLCSLAASGRMAAALFGILSLALLVNFGAKKNACLQRFENLLLRGRD